ncbi:sigma-70 family RNA polymerase sigma factor [Herminiimonas arsenitoxidans]|uniref:sigma-70 family RNA polymerase sigma factor n=1 Tax=Herminiimonas arsenitoxidans TaxID=1809410 RepID=UPI001E4C36BD|nr:sigma-70 family RNA polymerase sigma factor [Herminiimonas arsenitoxidans]
MPIHPSSSAVLEMLYVEHQPWLLCRLQRRLSSRADAEDVTSETFAQVVESKDVATIAEPRAFLTTIAKRILFHLWRRQDLEKAYLQSLMLLPEAVALSPEERAVLLEAIEQIDRALDALPLPVKKAFLYSRLDRLTYPEIAEKLGVSLATVERYMKRALLQCLQWAP